MEKQLHVLLMLIALLPLACGDVGPKPSADFYVTFGGQPIEGNFSSVMLSCRGGGSGRLPENLIAELNVSEYDAVRNCSWQPERFAWGGDCAESRCGFSYMLPEEFRLAVYVPGQNKVFVSDVIWRTNFYSHYRADLLADGSILMQDYAIFLIALTLTLFLELLTAVVFIFLTKTRWRTLIYVLVANLISLPVVWFMFPQLPVHSLLALLSAEVFAVVFEAVFLNLLGRLSLKKAVALSILMNIISFLFGGLLLMLTVFK
jgi:hypothetical protein